jgi:hypothetical protein
LFGLGFNLYKLDAVYAKRPYENANKKKVALLLYAEIFKR